MSNYITPETDLTKLPAWKWGHLPKSRIYFYDVDTRQELTNHPANGMTCMASHGMVTFEGRFCDKTIRGVEGTAWINGKHTEISVGPETFPGRKIAVKIWDPIDIDDGLTPAWHALANGDGSKVSAADAKNRRGPDWVAGWKAGTHS